MSSTPAILAEGLQKHYGKTHALAGLDLIAELGSVLGVLGPNGAGKTTAVRILTTLLRPDAGRAEVAGLDVVKHADMLRARIGLTGQYAAVDEYLTGYENLVMFGQLYHLSGAVARRRANELLKRFDLVGAAQLCLLMDLGHNRVSCKEYRSRTICGFCLALSVDLCE
jgi:ABC-2 type transport system ATP-binding protein